MRLVLWLTAIGRVSDVVRQRKFGVRRRIRDEESTHDSLRLSDQVVTRGERVTFTFDGRELVAYRGETVAAATLAAGIPLLRHAPTNGEPRGMYCGMGVCFECLVTINGSPNQRACITPVTPALQVTSQSGLSLGTKSD